LQGFNNVSSFLYFLAKIVEVSVPFVTEEDFSQDDVQNEIDLRWLAFLVGMRDKREVIPQSLATNRGSSY